jgi:uncharacterized protein (DUF4415 family)
MSRTSTSETPDFIDPDDAPAVTQADIDRAVFRVGGQPVERGTVPVKMMLDAGIVQYFKNQAGGRDYQKLIVEALGEYVRNHEIEAILRRVIQEEMRRSA